MHVVSNRQQVGARIWLTSSPASARTPLTGSSPSTVKQSPRRSAFASARASWSDALTRHAASDGCPFATVLALQRAWALN